MKTKGLHIVLLFFSVLSSLNSFSQITTTNAAPYNTPDYLVTDVLLGSGMTASNFTWQSAPENIGYFDGTNANIGFENGVLLCTGGVDFVTGGFGEGALFQGFAGFLMIIVLPILSGLAALSYPILEVQKSATRIEKEMHMFITRMGILSLGEVGAKSIFKHCSFTSEFFLISFGYLIIMGTLIEFS